MEKIEGIATKETVLQTVRCRAPDRKKHTVRSVAARARSRKERSVSGVQSQTYQSP